MPDPEKLKQLRNLLVDLLPAIDLGTHTGDAVLNELGLYLGLQLIPQDSKFLTRTHHAAMQKKNIAEFLIKDVSRGKSEGWPVQLFGRVSAPHQVFFECGSTIDPIVGTFARALQDVRGESDQVYKPDFVIGNNLFVLTSLVHLIANVGVVEGNLITKYFGVFPFAEEGRFAPDPRNARSAAKTWLNEFRRFARMCAVIGESNVVYATCSNLSLIAGPLVGSRANAIAKHAMYVGRTGLETPYDDADQEFTLAIHFEKLIPLTRPLAPVSLDYPGGERSVPKMDKADTKCRCILGRPNKVIRGRLRQKIDDEWHTQWCEKERDGTFVAYVLQTAYSKYMAGHSTYFPLSEEKLVRPWAEAGRNVRILIALPEKRVADCYAWLEKEVARANELHAEFPNPSRYTSELASERYGIAELRMLAN